MKKTRQYRKVTKLIAAAMLLIASGQSPAQTLVTASFSDNALHTPSFLTNGIDRVDAATIKMHITAPCSGIYSELFAVVCNDVAGVQSALYIGETATGAVFNFPFPAGPGYLSKPDVAICNDPLSPTDFYVVVAYDNNIDYYHVGVNLAGAIVGAPTYLGATPVAGQDIRIDPIADEYSYATTCLPLADKFVLIYEATSGGLQVGKISLPIYGTGSGWTAPALTSAAVPPIGFKPSGDVAGVQRVAGSSIIDVALVTWVNTFASGTHYVNYAEIDVATGTLLSPPLVLDAATTLYPFAVYGPPRIAAIDFSSYASLPGAHYKVAVEHGGVIKTYDDALCGPYLPWTSSSVVGIEGFWPTYPWGSGYGGVYRHLFPSVALSWNAGAQEYIVNHATYATPYGPLAASGRFVFNEPIDGLTGNSLVTVAPPAVKNYYHIPKQFPLDVRYGYANAIATPCNDDWTGNTTTFNVWGEDNGSGTIDLKYKVGSHAAPLYSYKQQQSTSIGQGTTNKLQVYPNPASDKLVISGSNGKDYATRYEIMDVIGRSVQSGPLKRENENTIQINGLIPGAYILNVYNKDVRGDKMRFIKN